MFTIKKEKFGKFKKVKLINTETCEYISLIPEFGANVNEIVLRNHKGLFSILDGDATYSELINCRRFKGAKLIPFPNRIVNGKYRFGGRDYQLPINFPLETHSIHGLVYNRKFSIVKVIRKKDSISVRLGYEYHRDVKGYPFYFRVIINYALSKNGFRCKTKIKNLGKESMPFGDGWHPYFRTQNNINHLMLQMPPGKIIAINKKKIPTGNVLHYTKFRHLRKIGNIKLDNGFVLYKDKNKAISVLFDPVKKISIHLWQETGKERYNFLQVFIPPSRKSIALEPMTCNINAFNNKDGLITLKSKEVFEACYGVYIK